MHQIPLVMVVFRRFNRSNRLRPVNRIKHVFDKQGSLVIGTTTFEVLVKGVENPTLAGVVDVEMGSTVNGIFLNVEVHPVTSAALPNVYMIVYKNPGGNLAAIAPNTVGANDNKRFVIHQEMIMMQKQDDGNPRTLFKGVIVIPRGYRRFAVNDTLLLGLLAVGVTTNYCVQAHYKEFR